MARIESLSILLDTAGKDLLAELYGKVIENVQKGTISDTLKNKDLSGNYNAGSVEAKRFANAVSAEYGTARAAGKGALAKAKPVIVPININREIVEEIEEKDIMLYGVDGLLQRRSQNHTKTMIRELERAFFTAAADAATAVTPAGDSPAGDVEQLIQTIETVKNQYVDGVDRDMMAVVMTTNAYGMLREYLDTGVQNANVNTAAGEFGTFHGVKIVPSVYLPASVKAIGMVNGSVAMPVIPHPYSAEKIPLSEAYAVKLFYYYGIAAVTPDLIFKISA